MTVNKAYSAFVSLALLSGLSFVASAAVRQDQILKPKAFFTEQGSSGLYEALDLKKTSLTFNSRDVDSCGQTMTREKDTLNFSCTLMLPFNAPITRLRNQITPESLRVSFGRTQKDVRLRVSSDAKTITLSVAFDDTGVDFEQSEFNEEFPSIYSKVAQQVIGEALMKQKLELEVLETPDVVTLKPVIAAIPPRKVKQDGSKGYTTTSTTTTVRVTKVTHKAKLENDRIR